MDCCRADVETRRFSETMPSESFNSCFKGLIDIRMAGRRLDVMLDCLMYTVTPRYIERHHLKKHGGYRRGLGYSTWREGLVLWHDEIQGNSCHLSSSISCAIRSACPYCVGVNPTFVVASPVTSRNCYNGVRTLHDCQKPGSMFQVLQCRVYMGPGLLPVILTCHVIHVL